MSYFSDLTPHETARAVLDELLLGGDEFFRWKEGETIYVPVHLSIDPQGYFILEEPKGQTLIGGEKKRRTHDLMLVSDMSSGRIRRNRNMCNLMEPQGLELNGEKEDCFMCLVERTNASDSGVHYIVNTTYTYFAHTNPDVINHWCEAVNKLSYHTAQLNMDLFHQLDKILVKLKWKFVNEAGMIELEHFLKVFNLHKDKKKNVVEILGQLRVLQETNTSLIQADGLTLLILWEFYSRFGLRKDLESVFYSRSSNRPFLEVKKFVKFLNTEQRDPRKNVQLFPLISQRVTLQIIRKFEEEAKLGEGGGEKKITFDCFHKLLVSDNASVIDKNSLSRCEDFNLPLSSYFINSSHNTYLTGNQLTSYSSVEMYIQALLLGSRCIELDCWDGNTEPSITHGKTLCSKISFEEVVRAIADFAFVKSDLPVILSFENHCSPAQQNIMARYCIKYFGSKLLDHPLPEHPLELGAPLPPPSALRNKILVKNKKADTSHEFTDSVGLADEELETERIDQKLRDLVNYCEPVKFKSFEQSEKGRMNYQMSSFSEVKALDSMQAEGENFRRYNITHFSRIYPAGGRINSSNYMPQVFWNAGCQMVALNYQTPDLSMQLNQAKFEYNGNCGFLLKPELLRNSDICFDPFSQIQPGNNIPTSLVLKVISAQYLGPFVRDIQVQCELFGLPADTCRGQKHKNKWTKFVSYNGVVAFWDLEKDKPIEFSRIICEELALLRLSVLDESNNLIAHKVLPVSTLQTGFRHVFLRDKCNHPIPLASLFVHITLDDYLSPDMLCYAQILENPENFKRSSVKQELTDDSVFRREALDALLYDTLIEVTESRPNQHKSVGVSPSIPVITNTLDLEKDTENSAEYELMPSMRDHRIRTEMMTKSTVNKFMDESDSPVNDPTTLFHKSFSKQRRSEPNTTLFHKSSSKQRQSEPNTTLPVIQAARQRNMIAPLEIELVLKDCKEYSKMVKKNQKDAEDLERYFQREYLKETNKGGAHISRMGTMDVRIGNLEREQKKMVSRPSKLLKIKSTYEEIEKLKESRVMHGEMFESQQKENIKSVDENMARRKAEQQRRQELAEKKLIRKLAAENHQKQRDSFVLKIHASEYRQLEKEIENKKNEMIQSRVKRQEKISLAKQQETQCSSTTQEGIQCKVKQQEIQSRANQNEVTISVLKMIESQRADLAVIHELELRSYNETSDRILSGLDIDIFALDQNADSLTSLPAVRSLDSIIDRSSNYF